VDLPLLIGGATTSRAHTALKIAPTRQEPVVHVIDASLAAPAVSALLRQEGRQAWLAELRAEQAAVRARLAERDRPDLLPIAAARKRALVLNAPAVSRPASLGVQVFDVWPVEDLMARIDWAPFFTTWQLRGRYPDILDDPKVGAQARSVHADALNMLGQMVTSNSLQPKAVLGLFPANRRGDDILIWADPERTEIQTTLRCLRQQRRRQDRSPALCQADFLHTQDAGVDWVGAFAVTAGHGVAELVAHFEANDDDYQAILVKALADRLAEALAERLHERVRRKFWGYAEDEELDNEDLIRARYQGIRPAPGYPACPDHTEKGTLWQLLNAEKAIGVSLTESFAMMPAASVCGLYFAHPQARYFGLGPIGRDQVADYAKRKSMGEAEAARWLTPHLVDAAEPQSP
jgi:5-methyltetrahydrofolate--homocysteine methyltransferase